MEKIEIINSEALEAEKYDVGGDWACIVGCGSFCILLAGIASYVATVTTALYSGSVVKTKI